MLNKKTKIADYIRVKISKNPLKDLTLFIQNLGYLPHEILFVSDKKIWELNKHFFQQKFLATFGDSLLLESPIADDKNLKIILEKSPKFKFILAFGSGTINDLCKYASFHQKIKYGIIISALSMNGYSAKNASISFNNYKKTLSAHLPVFIIANYNILQNCPLELTKAGLADVVCFYSCLFDIKLNEFFFGTYVNEEALSIQKRILKKFQKNFLAYKITDEAFLKILFELILSSGLAMTLDNSSRPASQSEHLIAHYLTMKNPQLNYTILHGRLIASTTLTALKIQKSIIEIMQSANFKDYLQLIVQQNFPYKIIENKLGSSISNECQQEFNDKIKHIKSSHNLIENYHNNKQIIYQKLNKISAESNVILKIFHHFDVKCAIEDLGIDNNLYQEAILYARFLRNRITCLDFVSANLIK